MTTPEIVVQVAAVARPGDTVLIGLRDRLCDEELGYMIEDFKEFTETTGIHIALVEGVTSMTVARPDADDYNEWGEGGDVSTE